MDETKKCPYCQMNISALATKCPHCQSKIRPKTRWGLIGIALAAIFVPIMLIGTFGATSGGPNQPHFPAGNNINSSVPTEKNTPTPIPVPKPIPKQKSVTVAPQKSTKVPTRDSNGLIHQLKIEASLEFRSIAFTSQENYTNCSDSLTVITVDGNQQPVFTTYKDTYSTGLNLFTGDKHSVAYRSLTNDNGDTLAGDIHSGKFGGNAAGNWGLTCDQGEYGLTVNTIN